MNELNKRTKRELESTEDVKEYLQLFNDNALKEINIDVVQQRVKTMFDFWIRFHPEMDPLLIRDQINLALDNTEEVLRQIDNVSKLQHWVDLCFSKDESNIDVLHGLHNIEKILNDSNNIEKVVETGIFKRLVYFTKHENRLYQSFATKSLNKISNGM